MLNRDNPYYVPEDEEDIQDDYSADSDADSIFLETSDIQAGIEQSNREKHRENY